MALKMCFSCRLFFGYVAKTLAEDLLIEQATKYYKDHTTFWVLSHVFKYVFFFYNYNNKTR